MPFVDPRVRVAITDTTIFGTDNPDRYPPDLETLVNGVSVTPIGAAGAGGGGGIVGLSGSDQTATTTRSPRPRRKFTCARFP